ncbi:MAG: hypothetical protein OSJ33_00835 [Muribaculaceae bacterium]|nr:hypothetical protein [Muribaculaceae bacterium]
MKQNSWADFLATLGLLLVMAGLSMPSISHSIHSDLFRYVYASGAVMSLVGRIFSGQYQGADQRLKRLSRMPVWSSLFYCTAAFFVFYDRTSLRDFIALTLAGAAIQIVSSVMIAMALHKNKSN